MAKEMNPMTVATRCRFCGKDAPQVNYKDTTTLQKYVSTQGKIFDRKRMGTCAKHQRSLTQAVKRARFLGLMKYTG